MLLHKLNNSILINTISFWLKATFAEVPGILETGSKRKVDRLYPFNEAVQWFIDHADLILLVYDYTKLDIGPETEALLDQLKGRESQVFNYKYHTSITTLFHIVLSIKGL